jgi:hypothetical protein
MRNLKWPINEDGEGERPPCIGTDWKEGPEDVLKCVDDELKRFGLEVVMWDYPGDAYCWMIARIGEPVDG